MANKINFITGETYTLAELFSGDRRIIIPDLQRDYCWGDENNTKGTGEKGELVTDFVYNLLGQFEEHKNSRDKGCLNLGLFYGYEVPANHIQLCDGQQRLTTLYLLLGMINQKTVEKKETQLTEGKFRRFLISDYEFKHDDKEPYLNYAIRESSLYFLSDLVCKFFVGNKDKVESIKSSDWYFDYYNLDPSIQSMLKSLARIEKIFEASSIELEDFGDWLLNKVTFLYFDMESRKNGEETFVVINTTGESLSSTQNLKPLVIQEKINADFEKIGECWEEIETWFWRNRQGNNDTADAGFAEFLRWVSIIEQVNVSVPNEFKTDSISKLIQLILQGKKCDFPYKEISFATIYNYWKALKWLAEKSDFSFAKNWLSPEVNKFVNNRNAVDQKDCFVLLPVLKYVKQEISRIESDANIQRNTKRLYEFFKNLVRSSDNSVTKGINALVGDAIRIVDRLKNGDIVSLIDSDVNVSDISNMILTEEEKSKLIILSEVPNNRKAIEEGFWKAQEHPIWDGKIKSMIEWSSSNGIFYLNLFNLYKDKFAEIFKGKCDSNIDDVRRALLTRNLSGFPRSFKGANLSFGWDPSDWQILINDKDNKDKFKIFLDDLLSGNTLQNMINTYTYSNNIYWFVKYPELLEYCSHKKIQKWGNSYRLVKQQRATKFLELETYCLYVEYLNSINDSIKKIALSYGDGIDYKGWKMWLGEPNNPPTLVFQKEVNGMSVAIDVHYNRTKVDDWDVQLFLKKGDTENDLKSIATSNGLKWNDVRYELSDLSRADVKKKIDDLLLCF